VIMVSILNKLIGSGKLNFKEGEVELLGTKICLIPPDMYLELLRGLRALKSEQMLYEISEDSSKRWFHELVKSSKKSMESLVDTVPTVLNLLALGEVSFQKKDFSKLEFEVVLENSLIAELWGKSQDPVDIQFAGYLAGAFSSIFNKKMQCNEVECKTVSSDKCVFIIKGVN